MNKIKIKNPRYRFQDFFNNNWEKIKFKKYIKLYRGSSPRPIQDYLTNDNGINWIKIGDTKNSRNYIITSVEEQITKEGAKQSRFVEKGELVLANSMSYGSAYELGLNGCIYDGWFVLREYEPYFNKTFLKYQLNSNLLQYQYERLSAGGIVKNISSDIVYATKLFYTSGKEQEKIAECLKSIDDLILLEEEKLENLKSHKKALLQKLFPQQNFQTPEWRYEEFNNCEKWDTIPLRKLALYRRGTFPQPYGLPEWYDNVEGMPFIQVFDVDENLKLKVETKNKISKIAQQQSVYIPKGTIIVTIQGSIGRVAITDYDAYVDRTLLLFEKFYKKVDKKFIAYSLQLLFDIEKQKAPGGIIKTITKEVLSNFNINLPEYKEQQKIADCISSLDDLISAQIKKIEALNQHKKGLLQGLFPSIEEVENE